MVDPRRWESNRDGRGTEWIIFAVVCCSSANPVAFPPAADNNCVIFTPSGFDAMVRAELDWTISDIHIVVASGAGLRLMAGKDIILARIQASLRELR